MAEDKENILVSNANDAESSIKNAVSNENKDNGSSITNQQKPANSKITQPIERKFELAVFDIDERTDVNGIDHPEMRRVHSDFPIIVKARSPAELNEILNQYKMCGQVAKIIREIDPPANVKVQANVSSQTQDTAKEQVLDTSPSQASSQASSQVSSQASSLEKEVVKNTASECVKLVRPKPKIVTIGDTQIKYDGDKVYQKQWVKLNQNEAGQIRIVNDSNNKILNLNGKHIEILRWVMIEDQDSDDDSTLKFS